MVNTTRTLNGAVLASQADVPGESALRAAIDAVTTPERNHYIDAGALSQILFGDHLPTNVITLGAAFQLGLLPVRATSIERAIDLNGVAVAVNKSAFRWGRAYADDPRAVEAALGLKREPQPVPVRARQLADQTIGNLPTTSGDAVRERLARRIADLTSYQNWRYAAQYAGHVKLVADAEARIGGTGAPLTAAVLDALYKLMAYKDEYEVARLHLDPEFRRYLSAQAGPSRRLRWHLHPPLLRALGLRRKLRLGPGTVLAFRLLVTLRRLRCTPLDPFGLTRMRKLERALIAEFVELLTEIAENLTPATHGLCIELARLPEMIRGYEQVKLATVTGYHNRLAELRMRLVRGDNVPG